MNKDIKKIRNDVAILKRWFLEGGITMTGVEIYKEIMGYYRKNDMAYTIPPYKSMEVEYILPNYKLLKSYLKAKFFKGESRHPESMICVNRAVESVNTVFRRYGLKRKQH